ncbi:uncharacterized protein LOC109533540 isoform X2 [Dendroctonus ponderosae]|uniref:uncharacterized protein LOC109533540 isoform X2 n=1 Tax=Dendroctonus ponderosae TaxID=77166 RepID=UPI002035B017|nr:uncharacterized protein LOC109533540 isoform X2 [Dendroctonus ponderosae]
MSPSVYSSTRILLSSANPDLRMLNKPEIRKVKRVLFGPVDPKATQKFLENELKKISVTKSEKWNFDFKTETTLEPTGAFHWRAATPRKENVPVKRKVEEEFDISSQYCDLAEADLVRPRPIKSSPSSNEEHKNQQSRITDFMKAMKRPLTSSDVSKKSSSDWNTEVPTKIPRLDISS